MSQTERITLEVTIDRDHFEDLIKCCKVEGGAVEKVASDILVVGIRAYLKQQRQARRSSLGSELFSMCADMSRAQVEGYKS